MMEADVKIEDAERAVRTSVLEQRESETLINKGNEGNWLWRLDSQARRMG